MLNHCANHCALNRGNGAAQNLTTFRSSSRLLMFLIEGGSLSPWARPPRYTGGVVMCQLSGGLTPPAVRHHSPRALGSSSREWPGRSRLHACHGTHRCKPSRLEVWNVACRQNPSNPTITEASSVWE
jgi:hypothetical protein